MYEVYMFEVFARVVHTTIYNLYLDHLYPNLPFWDVVQDLDIDGTDSTQKTWRTSRRLYGQFCQGNSRRFWNETCHGV